MTEGAPLSGLFYRNNRGFGKVAINTFAASVAAVAILVFSLRSGNQFMLAGALFLSAYVFFSAGKMAGLIFTLSLAVLNTIVLLIATGGALSPMHVALFLLLPVQAMLFSGKIDGMEMKEHQLELWLSEIEKEENENTEKLEKIVGIVEGNKKKIVNYRKINDVARKLTSALDKKEIVKVISEALSQIIESKDVKFTMLVKNEENNTFSSAVEEENTASVFGSHVKIHKKDPFDDWIEQNKYTLIIKNIDDDFRFKTLRRDWIKFKSMIAVPLIDNKNIIGILKFYSQRADVFDKEDARILNYLGDLCTTAVQNSLLYLKTKELAIRDGLTGLYMRRYFVERLDEEIKRSRELKEPLSYLMIDIDHFKDCNDTHGHQFGDKVLKVLGEFLKDSLRDVDIIGRYGGEEFAVLLPNTHKNGAVFVAERLRQAFEKLVIQVNESQGMKLTLSIGGIEFKDGIKLLDMINMADKALYHSKQTGRNKVTFWEDIKP